jgi:hypothetical protein
MKYYSKLLLFACLFFVSTSYSQLKGKCVDEFGNGIAFVNISIKGTSIGTVSTIKGLFSFENSLLKENDSLIFSHLNFEKKTIKNQLELNPIQLISKVESLEEVMVSNEKKKFKEKSVGSKTETKMILVNFLSKSLGTEIGKKIEVKKNKTYDIKNVQFNIAELGYKSATFRINFYTIKDDQIDFMKINEVDNIVEISETGLVKIDVSNQYLSFENDFIVSIECIHLENDINIEEENKRIRFSSKLFSGPFIWRNNVNVEWNERRAKYNVGIGIHLKVEEYSK